MLNQIIQGDCYELMKGIPDGSIDLVLTDPPYNTTACEWDKQPIDLPELWKHIKRVLKPKGTVVMTGSQPFTTDLIMSNRAWFKYELIWGKEQGVDPMWANKKPLKSHENIIVFSQMGIGNFTYNPQFISDKPYSITRDKNGRLYTGLGNLKQKSTTNSDGRRFPLSVLQINRETGLHPTQKPLALFDYLTRMFSNPGETVLDPFGGSGTTALAAHATGRQFLCFEKEPKYVEIANKRLALAQMQGRFEEMVG